MKITDGTARIPIVIRKMLSSLLSCPIMYQGLPLLLMLVFMLVPSLNVLWVAIVVWLLS